MTSLSGEPEALKVQIKLLLEIDILIQRGIIAGKVDTEEKT